MGDRMPHRHRIDTASRNRDVVGSLDGSSQRPVNVLKIDDCGSTSTIRCGTLLAKLKARGQSDSMYQPCVLSTCMVVGLLRSQFTPW